MVTISDERQLVLDVQSRLQSWIDDARPTAYADLFEGDDPLLTDEELRRLDAVDSAMERHGGDGVSRRSAPRRGTSSGGAFRPRAAPPR